MPRNPESMPFEPPPDRPPTPEETAEFERIFKEKPELSDALDQIGASDLRKELDEATQRGDNAAMNLWAAREVQSEIVRTSADEAEKEKAQSEVDILNVAIDELEKGEPEAALQYYDFDNAIISTQVEQKRSDAKKDSRYDKAIAAMKRQKETLLKYARLKRIENKK